LAEPTRLWLVPKIMKPTTTCLFLFFPSYLPVLLQALIIEVTMSC
jgi:hypothetical protein